MGDLTAAETARSTAVQRGTHDDHARAWKRWNKYCDDTGLKGDIFLSDLTKCERIHIFSCFAVAVREGRFSRPGDAPLAAGTVKSTINNVAAAFRRHGHENPTRDTDGVLDWNLARQFRAYKNDDPKEIQQKAIPTVVISLIAKLQTTEIQRAISQLIIGALFFACRSCEYLKVSRPEDKKTKQLTLGNIAFYRNNDELPHLSTDLHTADRMSITFETQKNERKFDTITQWKTDDDVLCPVLQWAALVKRILTYPGTSTTTPVSAVWNRGKIEHITSNMIEKALGDGVTAYGEATLRIKRNEVGTHSIRTGAAMAMYLGGVPVFAIMMIGRWSSDSFMKYIRKQVEEFTFDVSKRMLTMQHFRHTPHRAPNGKKTEYGGCAHLMLG